MTPERLNYPEWEDDSRPKSWERKVTVCIGALCQTHTESPYFVLCTDSLRSGPAGSAENAFKQHIIARSWWCGSAGYDYGIIALLKKMQIKFHTNLTVSDDNLTRLLTDAVRDRKHDLADEYTSSRFGISYDRFLEIGKDKFPSDVHRDATIKIASLPLNAEFVIGGFYDDSKFPVLCVIDHEQRPKIREYFAAAGEGADVAISALLNRKQNEIMTLQETLYNVYEAKKYAEGVPSVGKAATSIVVMDKSGGRRFVSDPGLAMLLAHYDVFGPKELLTLPPINESHLVSP